MKVERVSSFFDELREISGIVHGEIAPASIMTRYVI